MFNYLNRVPKLTAKTFSFISPTSLAQQTRNTFVLKRRYPPLLHKKGAPPRRLRIKHSVYDLVEDTDVRKQENLNLILLDYVEGIGLKGDVVSVKPHVGRNYLILSQLATYATPENIAKYQRVVEDDEENKLKLQHSSVFSELTAKYLSRTVIAVVMNMDNPWTVEKWHVRASLRKSGMNVPDYAIALPDKPISGPNLELQNKIFLVTVTINNCEKAIVRCKIHHWTNDAKNKIPYLPYYWAAPAEPVFPEDLEPLNSLPTPPVPKSMKK